MYGQGQVYIPLRNLLSIHEYIYTQLRPQFKHRKWYSSNHLFHNLIGLQSWLQQNRTNPLIADPLCVWGSGYGTEWGWLARLVSIAAAYGIIKAISFQPRLAPPQVQLCGRTAVKKTTNLCSWKSYCIIKCLRISLETAPFAPRGVSCGQRD